MPLSLLSLGSVPSQDSVSAATSSSSRPPAASREAEMGAATSCDSAQHPSGEDDEAAARITGHLLSPSTGGARDDAICGAKDGIRCDRLLCSAGEEWPVVGCHGCKRKHRWTGGLLWPIVSSPCASTCWVVSVGSRRPAFKPQATQVVPNK
jgi:hypothetical protein